AAKKTKKVFLWAVLLNEETRGGGARQRAATAQKNAQLPPEQAVEAARQAALRMLDRSAHSTKMVADKLANLGFRSEVIAEILGRFERVGLLDDQAYGQMLVRTRFAERGLVGIALEQELQRRGLDPKLATQIDADDAYEKAQELAFRRGYKAGKSRDANLRSLYGFLARKGYSPGICARVARQVVEKYESSI
ncbi:MAG: regulatory protein RecX, partial [Actinomycetaceae bacterium]|nr:regulatory protein RecX [Actinomycetaceae bacterium]